MSNTGGAVKDEAIREIAAAAITGVYQVMGGVLTRDAFRIWVTNDTNADIYLSTNGVTNMKKLPAATGRVYDDKTNDMRRAAGTQFYIKYAAVPGIPTGWAAIEVEYC